jgi:hypothetical protein
MTVFVVVIDSQESEEDFQTKTHQRSLLPSHGLIHGGEKGVVVTGFNEIGGRPAPSRRISH